MGQTPADMGHCFYFMGQSSQFMGQYSGFMGQTEISAEGLALTAKL